jgi:disulfide bond formation protein DsbB
LSVRASPPARPQRRDAPRRADRELRDVDDQTGRRVNTEAMQLFFALLALVALAGGLGVIALRLLPWPAGHRVGAAIDEYAIWLAWLVAATATAGSLYFSEVANLPPCRLCWFQRIFMYPMSAILLVGAIRRDRSVAWYALPLAAIGIVISGYHYLIEWYPSLEATACDPVTPCTVVWFRRFGFVSLPFMAGCGFLAIIALLACRYRSGDDVLTIDPLEEH